MADDSTAALVVALSAQVTKFEKDMKDAVSIADRRTREIEQSFAKLNAAINNQLSNLASSLSGRLGAVGSILSAIGPVGLTVAASLGSLALAFSFVSEKVDAFAEKAKRIKDSADTAGITITQFRLLAQAGSKVGLEFEQTETFINRLTLAISELRSKGSGPLVDALLKIDSGLIRQVAGAKDVAAAIDVLAKAFQNLTDQEQRNELVAAGGSRRNLGAGRLFGQIAGAGGLGGLEQQAKDAGKVLDEQVTKRVAELRREIDEIKKRTDTIWGSAFSIPVLEQQKRSAEFWERIALAVSKAATSSANFENQATQFGRRFRGVDKVFSAGDQEASSLTSDQLLAVGRARLAEQAQTIAVPLPQARPAGLGGRDVSAAAQLAILRQYTQLLGDAITPTEALKLKTLELDAAVEAGGKSQADVARLQEARSRALTAFIIVQNRAAIAAREQLGIASEEQILASKFNQIEQDRIRFGLSVIEVERARAIAVRESQQAYEALLVRQAQLPQLKQLELDAANTRKSLDQFTTSSLNNVTEGLADLVTGTKTASEAFKAMTNAILRDLARLAIRAAITGPLAGAIGSLFGSSSSGFSFNGQSVPAGDVFIGNATGTDYWRGGPTWVGERGPELVNLPRGSQIIPNDVARSMGSGNNSVSVSINLEGANGDATIRQIAYEATARGVKTALAQVPGIALKTVGAQSSRFS